MFKIFHDTFGPFFRKLSDRDTFPSIFLERFVSLAAVVCAYYIVRSADLSATFFVQDGLIWAFPACVFAAALWYALRNGRRYKLNLMWLLTIPPLLSVAMVYFSGGEGIYLQAAVGSAAMAFVICHMLRMHFELSLFKNALGLIAALAVVIGFAQNSKEKIWLMSNDINAYYFSGMMKGGYFTSVEELSLLMCAIIPFALSIISVRNSSEQKKIFSLFIFVFMWMGIAFSGSIAALSYASFCLLAAPFMYIGSRVVRFKYLIRNLILAVGTFVAVFLDKYYACKLTGTNFAGLLKADFLQYADFLNGLGSIPLLGSGAVPEGLPNTLAVLLHAFGWLGFACIAIPLLVLFIKAYLYWRGLSIERWPMSLIEGNLPKRERMHLIMKMRHADLNKSVTPEETIRTGGALLGFLAFIVLPVFTNCASTPAAALLTAVFASILIRTVHPKVDIKPGRLFLRFATAAGLVFAGVYCVIIPMTQYINRM